jgi:membrane protease subunit HflK
MIDARNNSNLLQLPLDKLIQQAAAATPAPGTAGAASGPTTTEAVPPAASVDVRSRENQRGRDRDSR